jgi:prevent-host-death family protein
MVIDYGQYSWHDAVMEQISISKFKATCLAVIERVRRTREPILVTRHGVPVAEIKPPPEENAGSWLGAMAGTIDIAGDIVTSPAEPEDAWEALRE